MKIKIRGEKKTMKSHNWLKTMKPAMFRSKTYTKEGDTVTKSNHLKDHRVRIFLSLMTVIPLALQGL